MSAFGKYTLARIGLVLATLALGLFVGLRGVPLIVAAFLGSSLLSFVMLGDMREQVGSKVGGVFTRINERIDANTRKEDID